MKNLSFSFLISIIKMCEFKRLSLSDKKYDEITNRIIESYPNACICWIDEIKNEYLKTQFNNQFTEIEKKRENKPYILQMFHGTSEKNIEIISNYGFDVSKNKVSAYGIGTYFAKAASYSSHFMKPDKDRISYMFLCDVIIGNTCNHLSKNTNELYDNAINNKNIDICVTPYNFGGIPKYIIAFYKGDFYTNEDFKRRLSK